jgi:hypothetical protein
MYTHMEYTTDDIRLLDTIANTKKAIPQKSKGATSGGKLNTDSTQSRTINKSKIISSKNRSDTPTRRVVQQAPQVDPTKDKIIKACANIPMFNGVSGRDLFSFMLQPKVEKFKDGDEILKAGSNTKRLYIPISGEVCIVDESFGMYSLDGFIECFNIFNLEETITYRKNKFTYIASGSGEIEIVSFSINERQLASSPKIFAQMYQNISRELSNRSLDHK